MSDGVPLRRGIGVRGWLRVRAAAESEWDIGVWVVTPSGQRQLVDLRGIVSLKMSSTHSD